MHTIADHYATLGLSRRCSSAEVRNAYRLLVKLHHPDLHPASAEAATRAQELNAAYDTLSDPSKRRAYDRELDASRSPPSRTSREKIERNIAQDVNLKIEDFFRGASLTVQVNDPGNPAGAESYELEVPPMTAPGARVRIARSGEFEGGHVQIRLRALPGFRFKIRGSDVRCELRISTQLAAKGGAETIAGVTGRALRLTIPPGVKRGEVLSVKGEGLPKAHGGRGDLIARITYRPEVRVGRAR